MIVLMLFPASVWPSGKDVSSKICIRFSPGRFVKKVFILMEDDPDVCYI